MQLTADKQNNIFRALNLLHPPLLCFINKTLKCKTIRGVDNLSQKFSKGHTHTDTQRGKETERKREIQESKRVHLKDNVSHNTISACYLSWPQYHSLIVYGR